VSLSASAAARHQPGSVILSKDVAELNIDKSELGIIRDGYRRGFVTRFLDTFSPF
jgi:flagellar L-ring protein precursor FlgH